MSLIGLVELSRVMAIILCQYSGQLVWNWDYNCYSVLREFRLVFPNELIGDSDVPYGE